jgi:hypothetical protein
LPLTLAALGAACSEPSSQSNLLFGPAESRLSPADKADAFSAFAAPFAVSADGSNLEDANCGAIDPETEVVDLNDDGDFEVFVSWGNTCTSGMAGRSLSLLAKDSVGAYAAEFGFPAAGWTAVSEGPAGWPDLAFGGPGFCHAVWARQDAAYDFKCNLPESPGGCDNVGNICQ